ncbi:hypothetical protein [Bacillus infantis]|uniref:hypothetical protein n=1 Tax=Bacillus infantis TaxID=324767 RepID=UPI00321A7C78
MELQTVSQTVLEAFMTDCLRRMESSQDDLYVHRQIEHFKIAEAELLRRGEAGHVISAKKRELFHR